MLQLYLRVISHAQYNRRANVHYIHLKRKGVPSGNPQKWIPATHISDRDLALSKGKM